MAELAIRGHATRGQEVIKILEMLGSKNKHNVDAIKDHHAYFIENGTISTLKINQILPNQFIIFTLEEFLEKCPYKVGDRVRVAEHESEVCISNMYWDGWGMRYEVVTDEVEWYFAKELIELNNPNNLYKEQEIMDEGVYAYKEINCYHKDFADKVRIRLGDDYEIKEEEDKTYIVKKKPKYPTTYDDCCDVLNIETNRIIEYDECLGYRDITQYDINLLTQLKYYRRLRICRDAYWKIAGKEMGLDKPWEPQFENCSIPHYCLFINHTGEVCKDCFYGSRCLLAFPTIEMLDVFYENFKKEIEQCKELL